MAVGRRSRNVWALAFVVAILAASVLHADEYFVNKQGDDANDGTTRETAFLTVQKGVDALNPGDTLTIGPGEYPESVQRENLGSADADTVVRAEIPGTALLRGDVPAPKFEKVEGYRFVYAASCDLKPNVVLEHNKPHRLYPKANVAELEFDPGFFHYDEESKTLYVSNIDLSAADQGRYTLSVREYGLKLPSPTRVVIDGLAATGCFPRYGIWLTAPVSCTIRNCVCYMNVKGIELAPTEHSAGETNGRDNLIENCVCYANNFSGISRYVANNDVIRNCYTYKNTNEGGECFGIMHYHDTRGPLLIKDNISWGQKFEFSVKPGGGDERVQNCVGLGYIRISPNRMAYDVFGGGNEYDRQSKNAPGDTVLFLRENDLDKDFEFADPNNMDFRLQPDSRFRGTAPDGTDRGAYQYKPDIFYVSPTGNDQADGLSMRTPWQTLAHALEGRRPGDTVYLTEGQYAASDLKGAGDAESPIRILGRDRGTVVISGVQAVSGSAGIVFERLNFPDGATLSDSRDLTFKNCTFFGDRNGLKADGVEKLKVTHCVFAGVPLDVRSSSGVFLSGDFYANAGAAGVRLDTDAAVLYSDYNNYRDTANCWSVNGETWSFAELQRRHDRYSRILPAELVAMQGVPRVENDLPLKSTGPSDEALGIHHEYNPSPEGIELLGPFVHSTSDTTANIEWWASHPAICSLAWGDTPEMKNTVNPFPGYDSRLCARFNTFSLTGLEPAKTYYFKIVSARLPYPANQRLGLPELRPENAAVSFETALRPVEPRVYYVAPDGNDANDGLSREQAFRTISRAADRLRPGDTVTIAGGEYNETVRIRAAGTEDRPITFRGIPGEKATLLGTDLPRAFKVMSKPDIRFDGLYFREHSSYSDTFQICRSDRVRITRCLNATITARSCPEIWVQNCVTRGGWTAIALSNCPGARVENNVSWDTILRHLTTEGRGTVVARGNVFCECWRNKTHQTLLDISPNTEESDNCFYVRWPVEEKLVVNNLPLPIYRVRSGSNAITANPMMPGTPGFRWGWQQTSDEDFDKFFTANPELILRGTGLQPEAFKDFNLNVAEWPYDRAWAEKFVQACDAADALAAAGKDAQALAAWFEMAENMPMCDRLKADLLEKASFCAQRLGNDDQAMELAKRIPLEPIAIRRQMQLLIKQEKYAALLEAFTEKNMGGQDVGSFVYPEREDLLNDLHYYRSIAYRETGDLEAAEKDLLALYERHHRHPYRAGESIQELTFLRLGDLYRDYFKDEDRALEMYLKVCDRTTWASWGPPPKPVLIGDSETLVKATEAACAILRKRGKADKVKELQENLAKARAEAAAALREE